MVHYVCDNCRVRYQKSKWGNYKCPKCGTFNIPHGSRQIIIKDAIKRNNKLIASIIQRTVYIPS